MLVREHGSNAAGRPSGAGDNAASADRFVLDARRVVAAQASAATAVRNQSGSQAAEAAELQLLPRQGRGIGDLRDLGCCCDRSRSV